MELSELEKLVQAEEVDTVIVGFTDLYGRLMGKRCDAEYFLEEVARDGTHGCDYLLTVDMEMEPVSGYKLANWERGYGDFHLVPDFSTMRRASWLDRTALILCDVQSDHDHALVAQAPRSILRRQLAAAQEAGFDVMAASELEYYIFENSYRAAMEKNYRDLQPAGWYLEDYHTFQGSRVEKLNAEARRHLRRSEVPVETTKGEWGLGQHELNIRYAEALAMADRHVILKQCVREIADQLDPPMSVTFMAKFAEDRAGSSCHIHMSLWKDGKNAFAGDESFGPVRGSQTFGSFLAGWQEHAPEMMALYAPTVNSYKRYQPGSWAPTRLAWSQDNRTAGFRVVGHDQSLRVECRIPGADVNPYLAYAAAIASGLDGVRRGLVPEPNFSGDVYQAEELAEVPMSLGDATERFASSTFAREVLGEEVVEHYTHFFREELRAHHAAVSDWERRRYFERI